METQKLAVYQIKKAIAETVLTEESTLQDLIDYLLTGKEDNKCPQCAGVGTINDGDDVCPTCEGDGYSNVPKVIDRENSVFVYKNVE